MTSNKLEILLRKAGRALADYQVARIFKVPEEMQQTPCDFFGYTVHGRAILIEAKLVSATSLGVCSGASGLQPHQWNELLDANRAGALALLCWGNHGRCATLSVDVVASLIEGRKSIPWAKIPDRFMRPMDSPLSHLTILDHWLPLPTAAR